MSKIEWEYNLVERPFCEQLQQMGWSWIEGDVDVAELTERGNFREVYLKDRLRKALRKINLRDDKPWLDDTRVEKAIHDLEYAGEHRLMEVNQVTTNLLLKGTVTDGLPDWDNGRPKPVHYIDFEHPENNDFLVINQFRVNLTSGQGYVIPDAVLFINGIPVVVAEFKSPSTKNPMQEAINQLLRYSNQRRELFPTFYTDSEGVESLFHTNQLLVISDFFESRVATVGAPPEAYREWADVGSVPMNIITKEIKSVPANDDLAEADAELLIVGPEQTEGTGTPLFFRDKEQRPEALRKSQCATLKSQQILVAGMLRPIYLLDLIRSFIVFQQDDGKTRKVVARYQQFRAVQKTVLRFEEEKTRLQSTKRDERGGIIWHTQGSGKSHSMVFLIRKMRTLSFVKNYKIVIVTDRTDLEEQIRETAQLSGEAVRPTDNDRKRGETPTKLVQRLLSETTPDIVLAMLQKYQDANQKAKNDDKVTMTIIRKEKKPGKDEPVVEKEVTFEENIHFEDFPVLNESDDILVLVDEAHRSHTRSLHRNLRRALPNAATIGFTGTPILSQEKTETREIFGDFIDKYLLQDAELDGATVPILYEGRTADGYVKDAKNLDQLFENMFITYSEEELATIKTRYGTIDNVLEAPLLIEKKARDMMRHYVDVILPEGYKAQVVATSRRAAVAYREKILAARDELVGDIEAIPAATLKLPENKIEQLNQETQFLIRAHALLPMIKALDIAVVISQDNNDPESWKKWTSKEKQAEYTKRFKRKLATERTEKTDPLALIVVNNMLITGFNAPVEQVMYLDRKIVAHDLLQAIARVNRTYGNKKCGYVVDYIGVTHHLSQALEDYDGEDTKGTLININVELPKLIDRRDRAVSIFTGNGITDLKTEVETCVDMLADMKIRAEFINKLRMFYETLNILKHRPEVPNDVFRDAKLMGFINKVAANLYRDPALDLLGVAEKVKVLINTHVSARGVDPKIPPTVITDPKFEKELQDQNSSRARAKHMQYAAKHYIVIGFENQNPVFARKMSEKLEEILQQFKDDWDALERELKKFIDHLKQGDRNDFPDLDPHAQVPFVRLIIEACSESGGLSDEQRKILINTALNVVKMIREEVVKVGFWKNQDLREQLTKRIVRCLDASGVCPSGKEREIAQQLVALAKENHENLVNK
ncbi:MAG: type I restriction endonuclease subunit R [Pseudohongiellaceae bacterium]